MNAMAMTTGRRRMQGAARMLVCLMLALVLAIGSGLTANADTTYIATWDEWKESGNPSATWNDVVDAMDLVLDAGKELYAAGDADGAFKAVSNAYYGYYETTGFERIAMGYISGSRKTEMELQFSAAKSVAKKGGSVDDYNAEVETLKSMLRSDANVLDGVSDDSSSDSSSSDSSSSDSSSSGSLTSGSSSAAATATFLACFSIILREGFEAILIVGAIIAYLVKSAGGDEQKRKSLVRPVYIGSLIGIVASFALAWLLDQLKLANSASQEVIEGVTALTAVVVLYYVSNWMLSKSESDAWNAYIKDKTKSASEKNGLFALAFTAFLAVFREGAEVVLFFQPMLMGDNISSVWAGFIVGCICLVFVYLAIHVLSLRIPLRPFFTATSILMFLMSISFLGAGIKELIEGDVLTMTAPDWLAWIPSNDVMDVLGIYGCLETLIPQLILLVITIVIFVRTTKKNQVIHAEAEARRAEEAAIKAAEDKRREEEEFTARVTEIVRKVLTEEGVIAKAADAAEAVAGKAAEAVKAE